MKLLTYSCISLKNAMAAYFYQQRGFICLGITMNCIWGEGSSPWARSTKGENLISWGSRRELGRVILNESPLEERGAQGDGESHRDGPCLVGDAGCIFAACSL